MNSRTPDSEPNTTTATTMSLAELLATYRPATAAIDPDHDWDVEAQLHHDHHPQALARLRASIAAHGIHAPVRLCPGSTRCPGEATRHVIDGHRRITAATHLDLDQVPVRFDPEEEP